MVIDTVSAEEKAGAAVYSKATLAVYDVYVLQLSNRFAWRCPRQRLLEHYDANLSGNHLDIGPGTGWYLRNATFPSERPNVTLMDLNPTPMQVTTRRPGRGRWGRTGSRRRFVCVTVSSVPRRS